MIGQQLKNQSLRIPWEKKGPEVFFEGGNELANEYGNLIAKASKAYSNPRDVQQTGKGFEVFWQPIRPPPGGRKHSTIR